MQKATTKWASGGVSVLTLAVEVNASAAVCKEVLCAVITCSTIKFKTAQQKIVHTRLRISAAFFCLFYCVDTGLYSTRLWCKCNNCCMCNRTAAISSDCTPLTALWTFITLAFSAGLIIAGCMPQRWPLAPRGSLKIADPGIGAGLVRRRQNR